MTLQKQPKQDWGFYAAVPRIVRTEYKNLTHAEKWLYTCLKDLCHDKGTCFRTLRSLEEETGISPASLTKMIPNLDEAGLVHAEKKKKGIWHISIIDIWQLNANSCSKNEQSHEQFVQKMNTSVQNLNKPKNDLSTVCSDFPHIRKEEEKETKKECSSNQSLQQPEITHTPFSSEQIRTAIAQASLMETSQGEITEQFIMEVINRLSENTPRDDVAGGYETSTHPSMQLSTQANSNVDKLADSDNGSHSQQSYSHRQDTSPATHVGVMPVLSVPMPPGVSAVQGKPQTPATPPSETLDEKKRLGLIAESIREKAPDIKGVTIAVLKFIDAWDQGKYGPCSLSRWEISNAKDIVLRMKGTIEDALLIADELKRQNKTVKIETVCNCWYLLETLKKPLSVSSHPNLYNEDNFAKDVWA